MEAQDHVVDIEDVTQLLGIRDIEIFKLGRLVGQLQKELADLRAASKKE